MSSARRLRLPAEGVDPEAGSLEDTAYQWFSDIDGNLGTGPQIDTQNLSVGQHQIELRVTDADGAMGHAMVTITVGTSVAPPAPALVVAPLTTSFVAQLGSTTQQTETLSIRDAAEGQLSWTATSDAAWLRLSELSGSAPSDLIISGRPDRVGDRHIHRNDHVEGELVMVRRCLSVR